MEFAYGYAQDTSVYSGARDTQMSFAPDTLRPPTYFRGELGKPVEFREAISALHDVVISDLRWAPKDRSSYLAWAERRDEEEAAQVAAQQATVQRQLQDVRAELDSLRRRHDSRMADYYRAQAKYFRYIFVRDYNAWVVLDPVITVHPDQVFFECFSRDESSYGRLSVGLDVFRNVGEFACGTTNIDYSSDLYDEFQKIRSYKRTQFEVDPTGFEVQTSAEPSYKEVKIDLPDSWVRGFLQVSSAMSLPAVACRLHPMDIHNICFALRRKKEVLGPRSLRYRLKPGEPVTVVLDPWGWEIPCPRSEYLGEQEHEIRVWGRRRLHILERLIPLARSFTVHLLGSGMPSFYVADLGDMSFTLGLSGWTANDWSASGNFDLLAPRGEVDTTTKERVFTALKENWRESPDALAARLQLDRATVLGALGAYSQAGRAIWDLEQNVYRARELSREPLAVSDLRFVNEREQAAQQFVDRGQALIARAEEGGGFVIISGSVSDVTRHEQVSLRIDADQRIVGANCTCNWHRQNRLRKGPCQHILALRMQHHQHEQDGHAIFWVN